MASSLVLPTDNAIIDYSIISQMIAVINTQQKQIDSLRSNVVVDQATGAETIPVAVGKRVTLSKTSMPTGFTSVTANTSISGTAAGMGLSKITSIVASMQCTPAKYCWLTFFDGTNFTFTFSSAATSGFIHIVAYGEK